MTGDLIEEGCMTLCKYQSAPYIVRENKQWPETLIQSSMDCQHIKEWATTTMAKYFWAQKFIDFSKPLNYKGLNYQGTWKAIFW